MWGGGEADNDGELWPWGRRARRDKWGRGGEVEDGCACSSPHRATPTPRRSPPFPVAGGSKIYPGDIVTFSVTLTLHHRHAIPPACGQLQAHAPFFPHTKQARAEKRAQLPPDSPTAPRRATFCHPGFSHAAFLTPRHTAHVTIALHTDAPHASLLGPHTDVTLVALP